MSFVSLTDAEIAVDKPITQSLFQKIKDNFDTLNGYIAGGGASGVANGSAEIDSDLDDVPDGWTASEYTGGTVGIYATAPKHGSAAFYMTHPGGAGNGGGTFTSDYVPCSDLVPVVVGFIHWATAAGMKNQVNLLWYDDDLVALGTPSSTVYSSTANPTSAAAKSASVAPVKGARYYRLQLVGGYTDTNVAGTAYFDSVSTSQPMVTYNASSSGMVVGGMTGYVSCANQSYTKCAEGVAPVEGTLYSSLWMKTTAETAYARLYINGSAIGTEHQTTSSFFVVKNDSSIQVKRGDLIQLYMKVSAGGATAQVQHWVLRSTSADNISFFLQGLA
jgi:hypothetical protein